MVVPDVSWTQLYNYNAVIKTLYGTSYSTSRKFIHLPNYMLFSLRNCEHSETIKPHSALLFPFSFQSFENSKLYQGMKKKI